ncbi:MAG: Hpt domain-containing protein [Cyanobacteria bacterium J06634_6]
MRPESTNSSMSLAGTRMLVIIPEAQQQSAILQNLEKWHATVYVTASSYEALGMSAHESPFDLAIISHPLADMNSGKLAESLRSHNEQISLLRLSKVDLSGEATVDDIAMWPKASKTTVSLAGDITAERLYHAIKECVPAPEALSKTSSAPFPELTTAASVHSVSPLSSTTTATEQLIDRQMLETTADPLGGLTQTWLSPFLDLYLQQSKQLIGQIRNACQTRNCDTLAYAAHTLKSSSAALGLIQISQCCQQLEHCGRTQQTKTIDELLLRLESVFDLSFRALEQLTYSLPA